MRRGPAAPPASASAVIYVRVSPRPEEDREKSVGIETQESQCRAHAGRLGLPVVAVYRDEFVSGKDDVDDRPGLAGAIEAVQRTPGAVLVVYAVSRLARRQRVLWDIVDERDGLGVPVSSATEPFDTSTPMGRAMLGMLSVWSQLEADMISSRTRDALAHLRAQGVRLGAPPMARREGGAELVERVREVAAAMPGASARRIAEALNTAGVPSVTGRRWHVRTVRVALGTVAPAAVERVYRAGVVEGTPADEAPAAPDYA